MKDSSINKIAWAVVFLVMGAAVFAIGLMGWGFVQLIQWITG